MTENLSNVASFAGYTRTGLVDRAVHYYDYYALFPKLCANWRKVVPQGESSATFRQLDVVSVYTHTEATANDSDTFTSVTRVLTPKVFLTNQIFGVESIGSSAFNLVEDIGLAAGAALARFKDKGVTTASGAGDCYADQYAEPPTSAPDHVLGTDGVPLTAAAARTIYSLLFAAGAKQPFHWVIDPIQVEELFRDAEAKQYLMNTQVQGIQLAATIGVDPNRFMGKLFGLNVWVADAMDEDSGLHSLAFGDGALGEAYKMFPAAYTESGDQEMLVDITKQVGGQVGWRVQFGLWFKVDGIAFTSGTNKFAVDYIS